MNYAKGLVQFILGYICHTLGAWHMKVVKCSINNFGTDFLPCFLCFMHMYTVRLYMTNQFAPSVLVCPSMKISWTGNFLTHTCDNHNVAYMWVPKQGRSHQIWNGRVSSVCINTQQLGGLGACPPPPPKKMFQFNGYEIASETIFRPKWCFSEARQQNSTCMSICLSCPLHRTALHGFRFLIIS